MALLCMMRWLLSWPPLGEIIFAEGGIMSDDFLRSLTIAERDFCTFVFSLSLAGSVALSAGPCSTTETLCFWWASRHFSQIRYQLEPPTPPSPQLPAHPPQ